MNKSRVIFVFSLSLVFLILISSFFVRIRTDVVNPPTSSEGAESVILSPTETSGGVESESTAPSLPYQGETLVLLSTLSEDKYLGDLTGDAPNLISEASYKRNLALCDAYGIEMIFSYTDDVCAKLEATVNSGALPNFDIVNINMLSDGSALLMNGGTYDILSSGIDLTSNVYSGEFCEYFTQNERLPFLLGEANPSKYLARYVLNVKADSPLVGRLTELEKNDCFTLSDVMLAFEEEKASLFVDEKTLYALFMREPLFGFEKEHSPTVLSEKYLSAYETLLPYSGSLCADDGIAHISSVADTEDGFVTFALPSISENDKVPMDMSQVQVFAFPQNIADERKDMVFELTDALYRLSENIYADALGENERIFKGEELFCFFLVFGWGDFDEHAYSSLLSGKTPDELAELTDRPAKMSLKALEILLERYASE